MGHCAILASQVGRQDSPATVCLVILSFLSSLRLFLFLLIYVDKGAIGHLGQASQLSVINDKMHIPLLYLPTDNKSRAHGLMRQAKDDLEYCSKTKKSKHPKK
jgi:hypothetical protein